MARSTVKVTGLRDLERALKQLPKATGKNVLRRVLRTAAKPVADDYAGSVRRRNNDLAESAGVSTRLSPRQAAAHRKMFLDDRAAVEMFVGAGPLPQAITEEFGTINQAPQGELRAAWETRKRRVLDTVERELGTEIQKAAARAARKAARAAGKG